MRYLESCIGDLKAGREHSSEPPSRRSNPNDDELEEAAASDENMDIDEVPQRDPRAGKGIGACYDSQPPSSSRADTTAKLEPASNASYYDHRSPTSSTAASSTTLPSPYFGPVTSNSSVYSHNGPSFSRKSSAVTTPVFGPIYSNSTSDRHSSSGWPGFHASSGTDYRSSQSHHERTASSAHSYSRSGSTQTSPVIVPKDQGLNEAEASTALLMLNKDRRHSSQGQKRGLSVKDLLGS